MLLGCRNHGGSARAGQKSPEASCYLVADGGRHNRPPRRRSHRPPRRRSHRPPRRGSHGG